MLLMMLGSLPSPALAQGTPEAPTALTTLTVVGKRALAAAARPTTTVLDASDLHERGATSLEDLLASLPGVQANPGDAGQSLPTLRGIGTTTASGLLGTQQATTGIYADDVPLTSPFGYLGTPDLTGFSLERLELMRGPQGVLYGSASLGGAIQYVLARPSRGERHLSVEAGLTQGPNGRFGSLLHASVDTPLADGAAAWRVEAFRRAAPGQIDNLGTGQTDADALQRHGFRTVGRAWLPGGTVVDVSWLHQRQQLGDSSAVSPDRDSLIAHTPTASSRTDDFSLARLQVETPLAPRRMLTAVTGWLDQLADPRIDLTRSSGGLGRVFGPLLGIGPLPDLPVVQSITRRPTRGRALSQELRVTGDDGPGLRYVVGLFLQATRFELDSVSQAPGGQVLWGPAGFLLPDDQLGSLQVQGRTQERAVFAEMQWDGPAASRISLGGRAFDTRLAYDAQLALLAQTTQAAPRTQERGFTPRLGVEWPLPVASLAAATLHATVAGGYRFGGANFNPPELTPYRSDHLLNREIGLRLRPADTQQLDLSLFSIDWRDAQTSSLLSGTVPVIGVANVGRARSQGVELAWQWRPTGPWQGTEIRAAAAGTDARTRTDFITEAGTPVPTGARLPGTPRWHTQLQVGRSFAAPAGWQGRALFNQAWVGARNFDIEGRVSAPGYARLDARLALSQGPWEVVAQLDNVRDVRAVAGAAPVVRPGVAAFTDWFLVAPRRLQLSARYAI